MILSRRYYLVSSFPDLIKWTINRQSEIRFFDFISGKSITLTHWTNETKLNKANLLSYLN